MKKKVVTEKVVTELNDPEFLRRQRQRLTELREEILSVKRRLASEDSGMKDDNAGRARDKEDEAQKVDTLDRSASLAALDDVRLRNIERALRKIDDGSYGVSEGSGEPIPMARLEASPEALFTVEEQASRDAEALRVAQTGTAGVGTAGVRR